MVVRHVLEERGSRLDDVGVEEDLVDYWGNSGVLEQGVKVIDCEAGVSVMWGRLATRPRYGKERYRKHRCLLQVLRSPGLEVRARQETSTHPPLRLWIGPSSAARPSLGHCLHSQASSHHAQV